MARFTLDQLPPEHRKHAERQLSKPGPLPAEPKSSASKASSQVGKMNKTETRYALILDYRISRCDVARYEFEAVNLRLGANLHYRPDFMVVLPGGGIEFHEVKGGYIREDAAVKLKAAAARYPYFKFVLCKYEKGEWTYKDIPAA